MNSAGDWSRLRPFLPGPPPSCCPSSMRNCANPFPQGCLDHLQNYERKQLNILGPLALAFGAFQVCHNPLLTIYSYNPLLTIYSYNPLLTIYSYNPLLTIYSYNPLLTIYSYNPLLTIYSYNPLLTIYSYNPLLTIYSYNPLLTIYSYNPLLTYNPLLL